MQRFIGSEKQLAQASRRGRLQQDLEHCGSVNDDQRLILSARIAAAGA